MNHRPAALVAGAVAMAIVTAACRDDGPPPAAGATTGGSTVAPTTEPPATTDPATTAPAEPDDPRQPRPLLDNADGTNDALRGVAQLDGFGTSCTAFLVDGGRPEGAAYALTNGHCVGLFDASTVLVDEPATDAVVRFARFADASGAAVEVAVAAVAYGSMRATDVAILELDATRAELEEQGVPAYALSRTPEDGDDVEVVGVPVTGVEPDQQYLRAGACATSGTTRLVEWEWLWDVAVATDCGGILGGNSGSPVFTAGDRDEVVGIVNTTTIGSGPGACYLGQPCEIDDDGAAERSDTSYFMPVGGWSDCWTPALDLGADDCPAETGPRVDVAAPLRAVRPGATWAATVTVLDAPGAAEVVTKRGPVASTDCRDADGYGPPSPVPDDGLSVDGSLPLEDGVVVLCAAVVDDDDGPVLATAGYAVMEVDGRSPDTPITLSVQEFGDDRSVEPIFSPPESSSFLLKSGPTATTDCAVTDDYVLYRRVAVAIPAAELPALACVIGEDEAGNRGEPQSFDVT